MLRLSVFVMLVVMVWEVMGIPLPVSDAFTCFPNQTIQFKNPNSKTFTNYRAFYSVSGVRTNCTQRTDDNSVTVIFTCGNTANNITAYFSDRSLSDDVIIGGAGVKYTFQCTPLSDYNVTLIGNLTEVSVNHTVESMDPVYNITANFYYGGVTVTTATVGQDLTFTITIPSAYSMNPLSCVATDGTNSKTLIINGCSDDDKLVSNFTIDSSPNHETDYNMLFHAFKFFDSDAVDLACTVKICIDGGCDFNCPSTKRKRALSGKDADDNGAEIASFSRRLIIKDVLGGSTRAHGSLWLPLAMVFVFMKA